MKQNNVKTNTTDRQIDAEFPLAALDKYSSGLPVIKKKKKNKKVIPHYNSRSFVILYVSQFLFQRSIIHVDCTFLLILCKFHSKYKV